MQITETAAGIAKSILTDGWTFDTDGKFCGYNMAYRAADRMVVRYGYAIGYYTFTDGSEVGLSFERGARIVLNYQERSLIRSAARQRKAEQLKEWLAATINRASQ